MNNVQTVLPPEKSDCTSDYSQWYHCSANQGIPDEIISTAWDIGQNISFVFHHRSAQQEVVAVPEVTKTKKEKRKIIDEDGEDFSAPESIDDSDEDYK